MRLPYQFGYEFEVQEHHPPADLPRGYEAGEDPGRLLPGQYGRKKMWLRVSKALRVAPETCAQVLVVQKVIDRPHHRPHAPPVPSPEPFPHHLPSNFPVCCPDAFPPSHFPGPCCRKMIAKLYDAKYSIREIKRFVYADKQYVRETAAYRHLIHNRLQQYIPKFYGSWSASILDNAGGQRRSVRMILTEYVVGTDMVHLRPEAFSQHRRMEIMRQVLKAESRFYACNLRHMDLFPRNVMITEESVRAGGALHIVIIDFGLACLFRSPEDVYRGHDSQLLEGRYISPILRWWHPLGQRDDWTLSRWIDWNWNRWLIRTFEKDLPDITPEMRKWVHPYERDNEFFRSLFGKKH